MGSKETTYTYDDLGQLTKEVSGGTTQAYTYDNAGNITTIKNTTLNSGGQIIKAINPTLPGLITTTTTLSYTDSEWGDLLTAYNGTAITYDAIGNPLTYYNGSAYTFTWTGRQLTTASKGSTNIAFTYDDNGIRTSKTVNNVKHSYYLNGSQIVAEQWSDKLIVYLYDSTGMPIGMMYRTTSYAVDQWDVFWFEKNLQGDIVAVYNSAGTKVATYTYNDAWGNHSVSYTNGGASTGAQYNPFRYRGYYYDSDLGMYYLQSRYYDAKICRFINADSALYHSMLGYNMFAYCENNPVNYYDPTGKYTEVLKPDLITAIWLMLISWFDGPLPVADILLCGVLGTLVFADALSSTQDKTSDSSTDKPQDPPSSVGDSEQKTDKNSQKNDSKNKTAKKPKDYISPKNNKTANKWVKRFGYNDAEEFKYDIVGNDGNKFNIFRDRSTGEIILISIRTLIEIHTDYYYK